MDFQPVSSSHIHLINSYSETHIVINGQRYQHNLILTPDKILADWLPEGWEHLTELDLQPVLSLQPDIFLLGTGQKPRFPAAALLRPFIEARIGYEIMGTTAACRTYNILATEGRSVVTGLLFDQSDKYNSDGSNDN